MLSRLPGSALLPRLVVAATTTPFSHRTTNNLQLRHSSLSLSLSLFISEPLHLPPPQPGKVGAVHKIQRSPIISPRARAEKRTKRNQPSRGAFLLLQPVHQLPPQGCAPRRSP